MSTLEAIDYSGRGDLGMLIDMVRQHGDWTVTTDSVVIMDRPRVRHLVTFDSRRVRDTWVHGYGCRAGFICRLT